MTSKRDDFSVSRLELVVLARHSASKPPGPKELAEAAQLLVLSPQEPAASVKASIAATVEELRRRGLLTQPARVASKLTEAGSQALRLAFSLSRTPPWVDVRSKHLPAFALKLRPGSEEANEVFGKSGDLFAAVLREHFGLQRGASLVAVSNALLLDELKLPAPSGAITLAWLRNQILARRAGVEAKGKPKEIAQRLALKVIGASGSEKRTLTVALGRRWASADVNHTLESQPLRASLPQPVQSGNGALKTTEPTISAPVNKSTVSDTLLKLVREALPRVGADGRFGTEKVFVSAIWRGIERDGQISTISYDQFKKWLVKANREGNLILVRADLGGAMNSKLVSDSLIEDGGATFHFVLDRRTGSDSERRSHAR